MPKILLKFDSEKHYDVSKLKSRFKCAGKAIPFVYNFVVSELGIEVSSLKKKAISTTPLHDDRFLILGCSRYLELLSAFLGERSEAYLHKNTSERFRFLPVRDIPLRFISFNLFFWALIGGFIRFLYKQYDGFTIYHIANFRRPEKFFRRDTREKNINFRIFL